MFIKCVAVKQKRVLSTGVRAESFYTVYIPVNNIEQVEVVGTHMCKYKGLLIKESAESFTDRLANAFFATSETKK